MTSYGFGLTIPKPGFDGNVFVEKYGLDKIDRAISSVRFDFNTACNWSGLGFAMAISRKAWEKIGTFAADVFGRGYHEETDWCLRAWRAGLASRIAANVFIPHYHSSSFDPELKKTLYTRNTPLLEARNPEIRDPGYINRFVPVITELREKCRNALFEYGIVYSFQPGTDDKNLIENAMLTARITELEQSFSYKIGRAITWLPRKFKNAIRRMK